jgi:hypothetical protein
MTRDTEQEIKPCKFVNGACIHCEATEREECEGWICPPKRPWVGLEAEDLAQIESDEFWQVGNHMAIALAVEAKLKERNT